VYACATERVVGGKITGEDRARILNNAERRFKHIVQLCMPDNDQYDKVGERREQ
jgi:hypothetical protein